jgi:hydrogenase maturation protease
VCALPQEDDPDDGMSAPAATPSPDAALARRLARRPLIVGVGNALRGDDGFGPALVEALAARGYPDTLDAGAAPENCIGPILRRRPRAILVADAVHLGLPPGEWRVLDADEAAPCGLSTHDYALGLVLAWLAEESGVPIALLAVQPASLAFGAGLSPPVERTRQALLDRLA